MPAPSQRPAAGEYAPFYHGYITELPEGDILEQMRSQALAFSALPGAVSPSRESFAYAPEKWTVRQVIGHLCDAERVFGYRAFRISRADPTPLAGFDENLYVANSDSASRSVEDLAGELGHLRSANLDLFSTLDESRWGLLGVANSLAVSVRALAFILVGHAQHHLDILRDRYGLEGLPSVT